MVADDLQFIDNVLRDKAAGTFGSASTRRSLFRGLGALGAGLGALGLMGGSPSPALAAAAPAGSAAAAPGADTTQSILNIADTAEHLAVTYLGYVIAKAGLPANVSAILAAARYEEQVHLQVLESVGAKPLTTTFSLPAGDLTYVTDGTKALQTIEAAEGIFVAAYLAAVADFAAAGNWKWAQYCAEVLGVEAEHRTLARFALGESPADNLCFEQAAEPSVGAAAATLQSLGFLSPAGANSYAYPGPGDPSAGAGGVTGLALTNSVPGAPAAAAPTAMPDTGAGGMARRQRRLDTAGAVASAAAVAAGAWAVAGRQRT